MSRSVGIGTCASFPCVAHVLPSSPCGLRRAAPLPAEALAKAGGGEPVPTPDQVRGRLSPEHALAARLVLLCSRRRATLSTAIEKSIGMKVDGTHKRTI